ncbi:MAG: dockerin type I repeat-containing protein [candidate division Zixibacteria bacterium]|nr:dockerin type I repeat-containing protein [candidate division Zixibacteria bacterium]MBU1471756.1 dockerin type I repeat-containing protein [candidate division Zixibacteria bacterium]MBU2625146.1 dockerin type I repeat-containing protein [candidate division Zixibacteria bacterium]
MSRKSKFICAFAVLLLLLPLTAVAKKASIPTDNSSTLSQYGKHQVSRALDGSEEPAGIPQGSQFGSSLAPLDSRASTVVGRTWYEPVQNGTMGRNIVWNPANNLVHFVWMKKTTETAIRKISYANYNTATTLWQWGGVAGDGKDISGNNGGYTTIDVTSAGQAVVALHEGPSGPLYATKANIDASGTGLGTFPSPWPVAPGPPNCEAVWTGGWEDNSVYIWPKIDWRDSAGATIMHIASIESPGCDPLVGCPGEVQSIVYYRYTQSDPAGFAACGTFIDSSYDIGQVIRTYPAQNKVALVYLKPFYYEDQPDPVMNPCGEIGVGYYQWQNDVCYYESTDDGFSIINGTATFTNVTDYTAGHTIKTNEIPYKAYTDLAAMYDSDGTLHIVWPTPIYEPGGDNPCSPHYATKIWHWDDSPSGCISLVYDASHPAYHCDPGAWNMSTAKVNISQCDDRYYVTFTRFGAHTSENGDTSSDCSQTPMANGDVYIVGSIDGQIWGPGGTAPVYNAGNAGNGSPAKKGTAVNLTNTWTDECAAGDCHSEHWPSMAMNSTGVVHIFYMDDKDAGTNIQPDEGIATQNDMRYMTYECFTPDPICAFTWTPTSIGHPLFISPVGGTDCTGPTTVDVDVTISNAGNLEAGYVLTSNAAWLTPASIAGTAPVGCFNTATETFTIGPIATEGTYFATITVTGCDGEVTGSIPVMIHCYCKFYLPEYEILSTSCWSVGVWNEPRSGIATNGNEGNMWWYDDSATFMYDEGLVITLADDTTTTWFSFFDGSDSNVFFEPRAFITTASFGTYEYAKGVFSEHDPNNNPKIHGEIEYFVPTHPDTCVLIEYTKICNSSEEVLRLHIGEGIDWDIPDSGGGSDNHSGTDASRQMVYQQGGPAGDPEANYFGGASICETIAGAIVLENDTTVYPNSGYIPAWIGGLLARHSGYVASDPDSFEDLNSFYAIYQDVELAPDSCVWFTKVKAGSKTGLANLQLAIDKGRQWAADHGVGMPCISGDADESGAVDIDDVVYLIAYIFTGGPPPLPYVCCGDADGSGGVDIDDVVYLIAYIFTGGPAPLNSCQACLNGIF